MPRYNKIQIASMQGQAVIVGLNEVKVIKFGEKSVIGASDIDGGYIIALGSKHKGIMAHVDPSHDAVVTAMEQFEQAFNESRSEFTSESAAACIMAAKLGGVTAIMLEETLDYMKDKMRELEIPHAVYKYDEVVQGAKASSGTACMVGNRVNPRLPSFFFEDQPIAWNQAI
ncbi:hypothetical protein JDV02_002061 [Purpureocillium takamizusanense]|uniref:Uncharacterized protein n=1 Tax=Purpureocillium takamizusanense TaxID=2060973 RepID=A0A9Q8Q9K1_9HYPO|nr:uncharacterized protein JDV02_002061 [Purpureocillium takamizusanense]UNI15535.1 hypothetical protein JDV02_002061 [Purpureocillium takamizusanense]